jgi:Tol biopolymer transport system component
MKKIVIIFLTLIFIFTACDSNDNPSEPETEDKIAFAKSHDIFIMDIDGSDETNITNASGGDYFKNPDWSPDGEQIICVKSPSDESYSHIYIMNNDGSGSTNLTDFPGTYYRTPSIGTVTR